MQLWDLKREDRIKSSATYFYRGAVCCLLVNDITSKARFECLNMWKSQALAKVHFQYEGDVPFVLVGN